MAVSNGGLGGAQVKAPAAPGPTGAQPPAAPQQPPAASGTPTGANSPAHGAYGNPGNLGPGTAGGPLAPAAPNGLAAFANSALGQYLSQHAAPAQAGNYLDAFQGALGTARSDIAQQLAGALSDIKSNQALAQQALGQLPGQINQSYGTADQLMNSGQHVGQQGQHAPGLNAATGANTGLSLSAYMAPERAAIAGERAGEMANVPLLGTGIQQAASQEAAAANNAALSDMGNLAQQQAQLSGQAQIAAMQQAAAQQQQQNQNIFGLVQGAQNNGYTLRQIAEQNAGATYGGMTNANVQQAMNTPTYQQAASAIASGQVKTKADLLKQYGGDPTVAQVLIAQYKLS